MADERGWELEEVFAGSGIYQMKNASSGKTVIQGFASKKANMEAAAKLVTTLDGIRRVGMGISERNGTIRRVDGDIVEVRVPGTVVRGFSYNRHGEGALVVLSVEKTHGGSGNIGRHIRDVRPRAAVAKRLLDEIRR